MTRMATRLRSLRHPLAKEFSWLSIGTQLTTVFSMAAFVVLVRTTSPQLVGGVVFAQAAAALLMLVLDVRFEDAVQYFYPRLRQTSQADAVWFFWRVAFLDLTFGAMVTLLAMAAWQFDLIRPWGALDPGLMLLSICLSAVGTATGTIKAGFAISDSLVRFSKLNIIASVITSAAMAWGAVWHGGEGYLSGGIFGALVQLGVLWFTCKRLLPAGAQARSRRLPRGFVRYLTSSSMSSSLALGAENGTIALAGALGGPTLAAYIKVAQAPGRVLQSAFSPLATQAFPRVSALSAEQKWSDIHRLLTRMTIAVAAVAAMIVLVFGPFAREIISLIYGKDYGSLTTAAVVFALAGGLRSSCAWSKALPLAIGRPNIRLIVLALDSAVGLAATASIISAVPSQSSIDFLAIVSAIQAACLLAYWTWFSKVIGQKRHEQGAHRMEEGYFQHG